MSDLMLLIQKSGIAELSHFGSLQSALPENHSAHRSGRPALEWGNFPAGGSATSTLLAIQSAQETGLAQIPKF